MQLTEEEQVEAIKKWWKENGTAVIVGVVIGIGAVIGVWKWREYTEARAYKASDAYVAFTQALADKQDDVLRQRYDALTKDYAGTTYAVLAAMQMAKQAVDQDDLDKAAKDLSWALEHASQEPIAHTARIRLARVLVAQQKYDEALALIKNQPTSTFDAEYSEIKGDIFIHKGDTNKAREAYQQALESPLLNGKRREYVQMKLSDLGANSGDMEHSEIK